jgi:ABC-type multidrug transport system fused ATPase/permease subunit
MVKEFANISSSHFLETINGLITIRAFGWTERMAERNVELLNMSQRPAFFLTMIQQWLTVTLNVVVAIIAVVLVSLATRLRSSAGFTGMGLVSLMSFSDMLASIVKQWTQMETSLGAVSRLKTFGQVEGEGKGKAPTEDWPSNGEVELKDVSASYATVANQSKGFVLSNVSLSIKTGEKVAICGRTGR